MGPAEETTQHGEDRQLFLFGGNLSKNQKVTLNTNRRNFLLIYEGWVVPMMNGN